MFITTMVFCQAKLAGIVVDSKMNTLKDVNLKLLDITGERQYDVIVTDSLGSFVFYPISMGSYNLEASFVGLKDTVINLNIQSDTTIIVELNSDKNIQIDEVVVTAERPVFERKIDRVVFNVENSIASAGTDLTQALALAPLLRVDDNGVSIVGKSSLSVMINERIINLSGSDLMSYLKSLRSDDVAKIEIITTPPSKYDAQGNSGLINIVLKKNPNMGWSGNLSTTFTQTSYAGVANSGTLNFQSEKVNSSLKLRQNYGQTKPYEKIDVVGYHSILSDEQRKDERSGIGANLSLDYKLDDKSNIGFIYDIGTNELNMDINNKYMYQTGGNLDSVLSTSALHERPTVSQMLNFYYDRKIGKSGAKLSNGFNFFSTNPNNDLSFNTLSDQTMINERVLNESKLNYNVWSLQSDLVVPGAFGTFEGGLKFTNFGNDSYVKYFNIQNGEAILSPLRSNDFEYAERNMAAYVGLTKNITDKLTTKVGLRYEHLSATGESPESTDKVKKNYGSWFPTFYVDYKITDDNTINLNYSRRINRPNFSALNPFRWYSNPYTYSTGNPQLDPSFNNNFELSYTYKGFLYISLYNHNLSNGFGRIVRVSEGLKKVEYLNYYKQTNSGIEASLRLNPVKWWDSNIFTSLNFADMKSEIPDVITANGSAFYYSLFNTFKLNPNIAFQLNYWHALPNTQGNVYLKSRSNLSSGFRLSLLQNRLSLNVSMDDILKTTVSRGHSQYSDFRQYFNNYYDTRRVNVNLTFLFGNNKVRGNQKRINFNETNRTN